MQAHAPLPVVAGQVRRVPVLGLEAKLLRGRMWCVKTCVLSDATCLCVTGMRGAARAGGSTRQPGAWGEGSRPRRRALQPLGCGCHYARCRSCTMHKGNGANAQVSKNTRGNAAMASIAQDHQASRGALTWCCACGRTRPVAGRTSDSITAAFAGKEPSQCHPYIYIYIYIGKVEVLWEP